MKADLGAGRKCFFAISGLGTELTVSPCSNSLCALWPSVSSSLPISVLQGQWPGKPPVPKHHVQNEQLTYRDLELWLSHVLAGCPWASNLTSLGLGFLTGNMNSYFTGFLKVMSPEHHSVTQTMPSPPTEEGCMQSSARVCLCLGCRTVVGAGCGHHAAWHTQ